MTIRFLVWERRIGNPVRCFYGCGKKWAIRSEQIEIDEIYRGAQVYALAAAVLTIDWCKNVFVFDEDIDVYNPTEILWALATRVQPHWQIAIIPNLIRASFIDPSVIPPSKSSAMIIDATRPLDHPFSPVSKCPDEDMERIRIEEYIPGEILQRNPVDRTTYWC